MFFKKLKISSLIFIFIFFFLFFILISGTIFSFFGKTPAYIPSSVLEKKELFTAENQLFNDLGSIRCFSADPNPILIVLSPVLSYEKDNTLLLEEITKKKETIQSIIFTWFSNHSVQELYAFGESIIKSKLIEEINKILFLGKIANIFFEDYQIFDP